MTAKTEPRNAIADLPRHVQGVMLRELLDGYNTQVPTVYMVGTDPIRFVHMYNQSANTTGVRDITAVIEGIFGTPITKADIDAGFDLTDEISGLFAFDVNFFPTA